MTTTTIQVLILTMIIAFSVHATYTDITRYEIEDWAVLFGTPLILIAMFFMEKTIMVPKLTPLIHLIEVDMTIWHSIISFVLIFALFLAIPVGGGDMKFFAFLGAYFGFFDTMLIFMIGTFVVFGYHIVTSKKYERDNPKLFEKAVLKSQRRAVFVRRKVPMLLGVGPIAALFALSELIKIVI